MAVLLNFLSSTIIGKWCLPTSISLSVCLSLPLFVYLSISVLICLSLSDCLSLMCPSLTMRLSLNHSSALDLKHLGAVVITSDIDIDGDPASSAVNSIDH